jgi:quercetin dioxygenase-like cupin family protein
MDTFVPQAETVTIRQAGEGERRWFAGGGIWTLKATAAETGGSVMVIEDELVRGKVTPLHQHPSFEEAIYVLEGELLVHVDGEEHRVGERGIFIAPRGVPHAFMCVSDTARVLGIMAPGLDGFYLDASDPITSPEQETLPADFDRLRAAADRSDDIELLGPPPFAPLS